MTEPVGSRPDGAIRVALLSPCFWPEVRRGTERFVRELADGLIARGHRPRLITSHRRRSSESVEDGLPISRSHRLPEGWIWRRGFEPYTTHVPATYRRLRRGEDDIAHAVYVTDALAAARWSRRTGRPSVLSYMGIPDRPGLEWRRLRPWITRRAVEGVTAVTALSRIAAEEFQRNLGVEARLIPPGVDLSAFRPDGPRAAEPTIFCAADLAEPRKRVDLLVEAFGAVRRERPSARLVLSAPRDPAAAARFRADHPEVELRDVDDRAALARAYSEAWVGVLPSFNEAFGLVLVEALACGTPVVAAHAGGMPEVLDRDTIGRLFEGEEPADVARALLEALELAEDPRTAEACRRRAEDFSLDRCVERYLELYGELLAASGAAPRASSTSRSTVST